MTQPADEPLSPLEMARNCVANIQRLAETADTDPLQATIGHFGERQQHAARTAACLALVSIAEDVHRFCRDASMGGIRIEPRP